MVNKVRVNIAGTPYAIATTDSEKYIQSLAKKLDEDITKLLDENENLSVTKAAVFCAMDYLDEYRKSTGSAENMRSQIQDYIAMPPAPSWPRTRPRQRTKCCAGKPLPCGNSWPRSAAVKAAARSGQSRLPQNRLPPTKNRAEYYLI